MPAFRFVGRTRAGRIVRGERTADSIKAAVAQLRHEQILVLRIEPARPARFSRRQEPGAVPAKTLAVFTRQLAVMIDSGLPLVQCLDVLGRQEPNRAFARTIRAICSDVESGASLGDAMSKHPGTFGSLYTNMIAVGETGGILETVLSRLATYLEKNARLKARVRSAMIYPASVVGIAALVVGVILWKVIPTFAEMFDGLGASLPLPTRVVIAVSASVTAWFPLLLGGIAAAALGVRRHYRNARGRRRIDALLLGTPLLGGILRKAAVARFCRTLSTLLSSGVPILDALTITAKTVGNAVVEDAVVLTRAGIEHGETVAGPLRRTGVFPPMVIQMVSVGEMTGALDGMLSKIADFYEDDVDTAVAGLLTLLEPMMIALLGVVVGGIIIAMYLPIFELISTLAG